VTEGTMAVAVAAFPFCATVAAAESAGLAAAAAEEAAWGATPAPDIEDRSAALGDEDDTVG